MALPGILGGMALNQANSMVGSYLGGESRAVTYAGNRRRPNMLLGLDDYIGLLYNNFIVGDTFKRAVTNLGYDFKQANSDNLLNLVFGQGNKLKMNPFLQQNAADVKTRWLHYRKNMPTPPELLLMLNRKLITERAAHNIIARHYDGEFPLAQAILDLRFEIPGPSDLIRFAVRDCFDPSIVAAFGYNKELPSAILPWMEKQGYGGPTGIAMPPGSTTTNGADNRSIAQWFDLYWWSHWALVSPTQGYEMLHRLYETSPYGPNPFKPAGVTMTMEDMNLLLKASDYPPAWRDKLIAISYHPLTRVDVRRMYDTGVLKEDETNHDVYHSYRQIGYDHKNADRLATFTKRLKALPQEKETIKLLNEGYLIGAFNEIQFKERLRTLGWDETKVTNHVLIQNSKYGLGKAKNALKAAKIGFRKGIFDLDRTRAFLTFAGFNVDAINDYLAQWDREREIHYKQLSTNEVLNGFKNELIDELILKVRLRNLGYSESSIAYLIRRANYELRQLRQKIEQKNQEKQAKATFERNKAIARVLQTEAKQKAQLALAQQKALEKATKQELAIYTEKNIKTFWKLGHITTEQALAILIKKGYTPQAAEIWVTSYLLQGVQ